MSAEAVGGAAIVAGIALGVASTWLSEARRGARRAYAEGRAHRRARRAEAAAVEAGLQEPAFEPENVRRAVEHMLLLGELAWRGEARERIGHRPDRTAIESWSRSWGATLGPQTRLVGRPRVDILRVINRPGDDEDRLVTRVRWRAHRPGVVIALRLDERWTLGHQGRRLVLLGTEGDPLFGPGVTGELIPDASADTERLREESLRELAGEDVAPAGARLAEVVASGADPHAALADLGLVDGRYEPVVIEAALRRLVETWEEASAGSDRPLRRIASAGAASALLQRPNGRLRIRDAELVDWRCSAVAPPDLELKVRVRATRYVVDRHGGHVAGDDLSPSLMGMTWTLRLESDAPAEWMLAATSDPAHELSQ